MTRGYRFLVPEVARKGIRRAYLNLNSPRILVNDLLQLRFKDAGVTLGRFVLNSTLGLGGLFDAGKAAGWERHDNDFGRSLAKMCWCFPLARPTARITCRGLLHQNDHSALEYYF